MWWLTNVTSIMHNNNLQLIFNILLSSFRLILLSKCNWAFSLPQLLQSLLLLISLSGPKFLQPIGGVLAMMFLSWFNIRLALLENNTTMSLIYPDRFTITRTGSSYSLNVKPTVTGDSGTYFCLVNGRAEPFGAYQLAIQGNMIMIICSIWC